MLPSVKADDGQPRDPFAPVLLGLFLMLVIAALLLSGSIPHDAGFWLWLDRTPR